MNLMERFRIVIIGCMTALFVIMCWTNIRPLQVEKHGYMQMPSLAAVEAAKLLPGGIILEALVREVRILKLVLLPVEMHTAVPAPGVRQSQAGQR